MKRVLLALLAVGLVFGALAGCSSAKDPHAEQEKAVDEAIHEIEHKVSSIVQLGGSATTEEIRSATDDLTAAFKELESAAEGLDIHLDEATAAHDDLVATVGALKDDEAAPLAIVMPTLEAFRGEIEEVHAGGGFHED